MGRKRQIIIIAVWFVLIVLFWNVWYLLNMPTELNSKNISEIDITVLTETTPMSKKIESAKDIDAFVRLFNSFKIAPRLNRLGNAGGWLVNVTIKRNEFPGNMSLLFMGKTIKANGKGYNINSDAIDELKELFFQDNFGEVVDSLL